MKRFLLLGMRNHGFEPCEQSYPLLTGRVTVNNVAEVDDEVSNRPNQLKAALQFVIYLHLYHTATAISNNTAYTMQEG